MNDRVMHSNIDQDLMLQKRDLDRGYFKPNRTYNLRLEEYKRKNTFKNQLLEMQQRPSPSQHLFSGSAQQPRSTKGSPRAIDLPYLQPSSGTGISRSVMQKMINASQNAKRRTKLTMDVEKIPIGRNRSDNREQINMMFGQNMSQTSRDFFKQKRTVKLQDTIDEEIFKSTKINFGKQPTYKAMKTSKSPRRRPQKTIQVNVGVSVDKL